MKNRSMRTNILMTSERLQANLLTRRYNLPTMPSTYINCVKQKSRLPTMTSIYHLIPTICAACGLMEQMLQETRDKLCVYGLDQCDDDDSIEYCDMNVESSKTRDSFRFAAMIL
mmetsp:Transcript_17880/g.26139  ORF Transcript_17880/g.26139 Transcript_17880/m.26139 type:complete len:114 (-) Transcript_17880:223-564(-)